MDIPHQNYDPVFKEAMTLYKDKALDFLGLTGIAPISEPLRTESVEIEVKVAFRDLTFSTQDGRGLHFEEEVDLSKDDMLRFGGYNLWLSRAYKREFITVIFVKNPTALTEIQTEQVNFKPIIVQCSNIDADVMLDRLQSDISEGKPVNELELVYLPLFNSDKFSPTELFKESTKLIRDLQVDDNQKQKIYALSIVLASKVVEQNQLDKALKEVILMGNIIIETAEKMGEKRGEKRKMEETAQNLILMGFDSLDIIKATGISIERLAEIREALRGEEAV